MGGKSKSVTVGYRYYVGLHFVLCHGPVDNISKISVDDRLAWSGNTTGGTISIAAEELFGGTGREGGVSGSINIMMGGKTQPKNDYLMSKLGASIPAFRGVVSAVLNQVYIGLNPYMKPWKFRATRIQTGSRGDPQWYATKASIGQDMNPAHIIRECLTNYEWGMGYGAGDIDDTSFIAAADTLYNEGFGLSFLWTKETPIEEFISQVAQHIDAAIYVDRASGKFKIKLIRNDYVIGSLMTLNETNVLSVEDYQSSVLSELVNCVTVNFWDASTGKDSSILAQDLSMIAAQGATINSTVNYGGVTNGTLAAKIAARDLRTLSNPIIQCTIKATRSAAALTVGDPFILNWPDYGVSNLIMRVTRMSLGSMTDGTIEIQAVQDVFGLTTVLFVPPAPIAWTDPVTQPVDMAHKFVKEIPYFELVRNSGQDDVDAMLVSHPTAGYFMSTGAEPSNDSINYDLYVDNGSGFQSQGKGDFCPTATLNGSLSVTAGSVNINNTMSIDLVTVGMLCQVDNEIMRVTAITASSVAFSRGVLDTVPAPHASGARIFFWQGYADSDEVEYVSGESVSVKMLPTTGKGTLALASASASSLTFAARAIRPYPPGQWQISGSYYPTTLLDTPISTSWVHRHRTQQTGSVPLNFYDGSVGPEAGTTYSIRLYNNDTNVLLYSVDGITGNSHASSNFPSPTGRYNLRMELWSVRDGYASTYKHSHVFEYINITYINTEDLSRFITEAGDLITTE